TATTARGSIEDVVARATDAVVMVETTDSRGTGFFVAPDVLVTNDHVVGTNTSVTVRLHDGTARPARVERTAPEVDLAVLRVSGSPAPQVLTLRPADDVRPGQEVIAIGSALGLQSTVTRGIISAKRLAGAVLLLQTDAAINPGNSGGPLLDRDGQVIGVTTLKMGSGAEGLGFAVAATHVRALLDGRPVTSARAGASRGALAASVPALANDTSADGQRARGQEAYAQDLGRLAQHAAQVDAQWTRFVTTCQPDAIRDGDRDWFALAERPTAYTGRDRNCPSWLNDMQRMSREFAVVMRQAGDTARRAGVYPGVLRDLRRQQRLDWTGFER
ncbi:MAG TPA: trypsin-like peptidase domain-containing protein, partial [Vicinamibacterales bacterium]|nr:trypsin-like peptidase domain-containing protein [Vicinamibacterales bacterium]